ncbi:MAG: flavoprotein [Ktedonobacterales bacterium]|nr:flavoprotein [Ktedonobacterales bacterium]
MDGKSKVLYHIVCAAPPTQQIESFITAAQHGGWDVCVIATPNAMGFLDEVHIRNISGYPVRAEFKRFGEPDELPKADAVVTAPATFNTINKLALGINDTLALGQLTKALGLKIPLIMAPCITHAYANHPQFKKSLRILRRAGVEILYDPINYHAPKIIPWANILEALDRKYERGDKQKISLLEEGYAEFKSMYQRIRTQLAASYAKR